VDGAPRPPTVTLLSIALVLLAIVTGLAGVAVSELSQSFGADYDRAFAVVGLLVGAALAVAGLTLWTGAAPAWLVVVLTSSFPLMCVVGASSSSDLSAMLGPAVVAWLALWWLLRRPATAAWLRSQHDAGRNARGDSWL
jgi:hypothetical protein